MPSATPTSEEVAQARARDVGIEILALPDAQRELNARMARGWVMMDLLCPITRYPLLKDPRTGVVWSVRCQMEVGSDTSHTVTSDEATGARPGKRGGTGPDGFADADLQSQRMADKMCLGWQLTGDLCPLSHRCPLLLDKRKGKMWSAAVGRYVTPEGAIDESEPDDTSVAPVPAGARQSPRASAAPPAAAAPAPAAVAAAAGAATAPAATAAAAPSPAAKAGAFKVPSTDVMSKRIGDKLLRGWVMLSAECPVTRACPLLQEPRSKRLWSAALDDFVDHGPKAAPSPAPAAPSPRCGAAGGPGAQAAQAAAQAASDALDRELEHELMLEEEQRNAAGSKAPAPRHANEDKFDVVTKRIGDKLLAGWTMLERTCPVTNQCPLMREPGGVRLYSAQLDRFLTEEELSGSSSSSSTATTSSSSSCSDGAASASAAAKTVRAGSVAKTAPKASAPEEDLAQFLVGSWKEAAEHALEEDLEGLNGGPPRQHPFKESSGKTGKAMARAMGLRGAASNSGADAASTRSVLSGVSVNGDTDLELERAEAAVRSKLKECRRALAGLDVGNGADANVLAQVERLVAVLGTCGQALDKLRPRHL